MRFLQFFLVTLLALSHLQGMQMDDYYTNNQGYPCHPAEPNKRLPEGLKVFKPKPTVNYARFSLRIVTQGGKPCLQPTWAKPNNYFAQTGIKSKFWLLDFSKHPATAWRRDVGLYKPDFQQQEEEFPGSPEEEAIIGQLLKRAKQPQTPYIPSPGKKVPTASSHPDRLEKPATTVFLPYLPPYPTNLTVVKRGEADLSAVYFIKNILGVSEEEFRKQLEYYTPECTTEDLLEDSFKDETPEISETGNLRLQSALSAETIKVLEDAAGLFRLRNIKQLPDDIPSPNPQDPGELIILSDYQVGGKYVTDFAAIQNWVHEGLQSLYNMQPFDIRAAVNEKILARLVTEVRFLQAIPHFKNAAFQIASTHTCIEGEVDKISDIIKFSVQGENAALCATPALVARRYLYPSVSLFDPKAAVPFNTDMMNIGIHKNVKIVYGYANWLETDFGSGPRANSDIIMPAGTDQRVTQIFASGINLSKHAGGGHTQVGQNNVPYAWKNTTCDRCRAAYAVLKKMYLGTLLAAIEAECQTIVLTLLGASAFRNNLLWIRDALQQDEFIELIAKYGLKVYIVVKYSDRYAAHLDEFINDVKKIQTKIAEASQEIATQKLPTEEEQAGLQFFEPLLTRISEEGEKLGLSKKQLEEIMLRILQNAMTQIRQIEDTGKKNGLSEQQIKATIEQFYAKQLSEAHQLIAQELPESKGPEKKFPRQPTIKRSPVKKEPPVITAQKLPQQPTVTVASTACIAPINSFEIRVITTNKYIVLFDSDLNIDESCVSTISRNGKVTIKDTDGKKFTSLTIDEALACLRQKGNEMFGMSLPCRHMNGKPEEKDFYFEKAVDGGIFKGDKPLTIIDLLNKAFGLQ